MSTQREDGYATQFPGIVVFCSNAGTNSYVDCVK